METATQLATALQQAVLDAEYYEQICTLKDCPENLGLDNGYVFDNLLIGSSDSCCEPCLRQGYITEDSGTIPNKPVDIVEMENDSNYHRCIYRSRDSITFTFYDSSVQRDIQAGEFITLSGVDGSVVGMVYKKYVVDDLISATKLEVIFPNRSDTFTSLMEPGNTLNLKIFAHSSNFGSITNDVTIVATTITNTIESIKPVISYTNNEEDENWFIGKTMVIRTTPLPSSDTVEYIEKEIKQRDSNGDITSGTIVSFVNSDEYSDITIRVNNQEKPFYYNPDHSLDIIFIEPDSMTTISYADYSTVGFPSYNQNEVAYGILWPCRYFNFVSSDSGIPSNSLSCQECSYGDNNNLVCDKWFCNSGYYTSENGDCTECSYNADGTNPCGCTVPVNTNGYVMIVPQIHQVSRILIQIHLMK